jgi:citrate synthase
MERFETLGEIARHNNEIRPSCYQRYNVKDGLRNADGSGVLVGLTTISAVIGYQKIDEELIPVPGQLKYRGIEVGELVKSFREAGRYGFEETAYLLLFGHRPSMDERLWFEQTLGGMRALPKNFARDVLQTFRTPDIMNALGRSILTLYGIDENPEDLTLGNQVRQAMEMVARVATLVPHAHYSIQQGFHGDSLIIHRPDPALGTAENFLRLLRPDKSFTEVEARVLDTTLVLHADHGGGNNSTFSTRVVSSTLTDTYSALGAAIGSLKGPLHGGANVRVAKMMDDIKERLGPRPKRDALRGYLLDVLAGKALDGSGKIYGLGHAVYTLSDPRALILKEEARDLAVEKGREDDFALYEAVEELAPGVLQEYKNNPDAAVCINVDFYSGFVYDSLRFPREVFTPLFAVGRMPGWTAHRIEMLTNHVKIMRPAYKTVDATCRPRSATMCDHCARNENGEIRSSSL